MRSPPIPSFSIDVYVPLMWLAILLGAGCAAPPPAEAPKADPARTVAAAPVRRAGDYFPAGDVNRGFDAFESHGCATCHTVRGYDFPASRRALPVRPVLGAVVTELPSDLALFTAIVDPSHELAPDHLQALARERRPPIMRSYRGLLTVQEVLDLIAFVREAYEVAPAR